MPCYRGLLVLEKAGSELAKLREITHLGGGIQVPQQLRGKGMEHFQGIINGTACRQFLLVDLTPRESGD